jgi:hypothetical protein
MVILGFSYSGFAAVTTQKAAHHRWPRRPLVCPDCASGVSLFSSL